MIFSGTYVGDTLTETLTCKVTGYVFRSAAAIAPFLEHPKTGPTSSFCSSLSARLRCYVVAGYPERLGDAERATRVGSTGNEQAPTAVGANSAVIYGPDGQWVGGYRKTHLYKEDMCWAKPGAYITMCNCQTTLDVLAGTGFATFHLPSPLNTLTLGLCMDLNPQTTSWSMEEGPYELAQHCLDTKSNVLLLLNAWLDSAAEIEEDSDWQTLNYWAARLRPLWHSSSDQGLSVANNATSVVICNRAGTEEGQ
jgi:protein N-terminal amidase